MRFFKNGFMAAALLCAASLTTTANAATSTTGCASATSCTFSELLGGGSIQADDVQISGVSLNAGSFSSPMLDLSSFSISGIMGTNPGFTLDFGGATVSGQDFIGLVLDFNLAVVGSTRNIISAAFDNWSSSRTGDASLTNAQMFADFGTVGSAPLIDVLDDAFSPLKVSDSTAIAPTTSIAGQFSLFQSAFGDPNSSFTNNSIDLTFGLNGTLPPATIPLPAGGILLLSAFGLLAASRRRKA